MQLGAASFGGIGQVSKLIMDHFSTTPIPIPPGTTPTTTMGKGIAVRASDICGGQQTGESLQSFFNVEKLLAVVLGDVVQPHGSHAYPRMNEALNWFRIDGIPTCRLGQHADCGHVTSGRDWYFLNEGVTWDLGQVPLGAGTGSLSVAAGVISASPSATRVSMFGAGVLAVSTFGTSATVQQTVLAGVGSLSVSTVVPSQFGAAFGGAGGLAIAPQGVEQAQASFVGVGTLVFLGNAPIVASGTYYFDTTGASPSAPVVTSATFSFDTTSAPSAPPVVTNAVFNLYSSGSSPAGLIGSGNLAARAQLLLQDAASFAGTSFLGSATGSVPIVGSAVFGLNTSTVTEPPALGERALGEFGVSTQGSPTITPATFALGT